MFRSYKNENLVLHKPGLSLKGKLEPAHQVDYIITNKYKNVKSFKEQLFTKDKLTKHIVYHGTHAKFNKDKIFYHGSNVKFDKFDKTKIKENKLGLCFNFTDDYFMAYQYGDNILKVKLDLNNPLTIDIWDETFPYEWWNQYGKRVTGQTKDFPKDEYEASPETYGEMFNQYKMDEKFIKILEEMGFDGVAFPEDHHYGVFEPEQIHILNGFRELNEQLQIYLN